MLITDLSISIPPPAEIQIYGDDGVVETRKIYLPHFLDFEDKNDEHVEKKNRLIRAFRDLMVSLQLVLTESPDHEDTFARILPKYFPDHQDQRVKNLFRTLLGPHPDILGTPMIGGISITNIDFEGECEVVKGGKKPEAYSPSSDPSFIVFCDRAFKRPNMCDLDCKYVENRIRALTSLALILLHELMYVINHIYPSLRGC